MTSEINLFRPYKIGLGITQQVKIKQIAFILSVCYLTKSTTAINQIFRLILFFYIKRINKIFQNENLNDRIISV